MDKQTHKFVILAGLGLLTLGTGACNQAPPEDTTPAVVPTRKPGSTPPGAAMQTSPPGSPATTPDAPPAQKGAPPAGGKAGAKQQAGKKGSPDGAAMAKGKGDPFAPGGMKQAAPGGAAPAGTAPGAPELPRILAYSGRRKDPFYIDWKLPVPPPYVFDEVEPIRLASIAVETPPTEPYEVREQPEMRVSGIMTGDGVFAILESGGDKVDLVKPGSSVDISVAGQTKRTYKVVSITKDKVKLRSQVGNVIYTQEVPLSDVAVGTAPRSGAMGGGMSGPAPGMAMPGGGRPGGSSGPGGGAAFGPGGGGFGPGPGSPGGSSGGGGRRGGGRRGGG